MRVTITGINYKFDNGYEQDYTGVELQYITNGFKIGNNDPIEITKQQYEENDRDGLRALVVEKKLAEANAYVDEITEYKNTLVGE